MREIKFRGKRIDNGEWVYGGYFCTCDGDMTRAFILTNCQTLNFKSEDTVFKGYEVIPETVGQYVDVKDKNGVEIYEGDILKIDEGHTVEVRYEKISASFGIWRKGWAFLHYFHEAVEPKDCEVIGNIHDKKQQKQALIDTMRGDEEIGLYDDNPKNH